MEQGPAENNANRVGLTCGIFADSETWSQDRPPSEPVRGHGIEVALREFSLAKDWTGYVSAKRRVVRLVWLP